MQVKIGEIEINVKKYVEEEEKYGSLFITDSEVKADDFEKFLDFYYSHMPINQYFRTMFSEKEFYGRFGQLVYSKHEDVCKLRLVFVEAQQDQDKSAKLNFVARDVEYENLIRKIVHQEIILDQLRFVLEEKNILSRDELERIFMISDDTLISKSREIYTKVKDLDEYLIRMNDTLKEIEQKS